MGFRIEEVSPGVRRGNGLDFSWTGNIYSFGSLGSMNAMEIEIRHTLSSVSGSMSGVNPGDITAPVIPFSTNASSGGNFVTKARLAGTPSITAPLNSPPRQILDLRFLATSGNVPFNGDYYVTVIVRYLDTRRIGDTAQILEEHSASFVYRSGFNIDATLPAIAATNLVGVAIDWKSIRLSWTSAATTGNQQTDRPTGGQEGGTGTSYPRIDPTIYKPGFTPNGPSTVFSNLKPDQLYWLRVDSYNPSTPSELSVTPSETIYVRTLPEPPAPSAPILGSATPNAPLTASTPVAVTVTCTSPLQDGSILRYYRSTTINGVYSLVGTVEINNWNRLGTLYDSGLSYSTSYFYKATLEWANNTLGASEYSNIVSATTAAIPGSPTAPSGLTATSGGYDSINLAWTDNSSNETGFEIWRSDASDVLNFVKVASAPIGAVSHTDTGLTAGVTYTYKIRAFNAIGKSAFSSTASASTDAAPLAPDAPTSASVVAISETKLTVSWVHTVTSGGAPDGFYIYRSTTLSGTYTRIYTASADATSYTDTRLNSGSTYYYRVSAYNYGGESGYASANGATDVRTTGNLIVSAFSFTPGARVTIVFANGKTFFFSDLDRGVIHMGSHWFLRGLKQHRYDDPPTTSAITTGGLTGTWEFYVVLYSSERQVRSPHGPAVSVSLTSQRLTITAPNEGGNVKIRDEAYDDDGNAIDAADFWEIYAREVNTMKDAYHIATVPISTISYEIPSIVTKSWMSNGTHRPMERLGETDIGPANGVGVYFNQHLWHLFQSTIKPNATEQLTAELTLEEGSSVVTVTGYTFTDALLAKELMLSDAATGWFVEDVLDESTLLITFPADDTIDAGGWNNADATVIGAFSFAGKQSQVSASGLYTGGPNGALVTSNETLPALTTYEEQFIPEDNTDPNGAVAVRDHLLVSKPGKWLVVSGGYEANFPRISVSAISRTSGCIAPRTIARDRNDLVYFLADNGCHMVRVNAIEQVSVRARMAHVFTKIFDINSVKDGVGEWFSKEDWYIAMGLNRIGAYGNTDGFIYDSRNEAIFPITSLTRITSLKQLQVDNGEFRMICGDERGNIIMKFVDRKTHGYDRTLSTPNATEQPMSCWVRTGIYNSQDEFSARALIPSVKQTPFSSSYQYNVKFDCKDRNDNPDQFTPSFETGLLNVSDEDFWVTLEAYRTQSLQMQIEFDTLVADPMAEIQLRQFQLTMDEIYGR